MGGGCREHGADTRVKSVRESDFTHKSQTVNKKKLACCARHRLSSIQADVTNVKCLLDQVQMHLLISREAEQRKCVVVDRVARKEFPDNLSDSHRV